LTAAAVLVSGYHYGIEDMAVYLPAIKKLLHPDLYPFDANFFLLYIRLTLFHQAVAEVVRLTHLSLEWVAFLWHGASIFLLLLAALRLTRRCFREAVAHWTGVILLAVLLTLPVAGTALFIVDQYMHPRTLATAFLLFALVDVLEWRPTTFLWLCLAGLCHPTMALYGTFHVAVLGLARPVPQFGVLVPSIPFGVPANPIWRQVMSHRDFQYPFRWAWYEWLGAVGPLMFLGYFAKLARRDELTTLERVCNRLVVSTSLGIAGAVILTQGFQNQTWARLEPMRILHVTYVVFVLFSGSLLGKYVLGEKWLRWCGLFLSLSLTMFYFQLLEFPSSHHIEWPGKPSTNTWVQAFAWASHNTPRSALFALDPQYMKRPGQDFYGFRGLAERSALADDSKDPSVVEVFPDLAWQWKLEVDATANWTHFTLADFKRLKHNYGVTWVVLERPAVPGLVCPYSSSSIAVCEIP
jgi:hypothetical protein